MSASTRTIYLSTSDGLYRARSDGETYTVDCLGFKGKGEFRAPVLVDREDPQLLYAGTTKSGMYRSRDGGMGRDRRTSAACDGSGSIRTMRRSSTEQLRKVGRCGASTVA
jgi:hypothetical protein